MNEEGDRRLSMRIRSSPEAPSLARRAVSQLVEDHPVPAPRRDMLILLISEIVTNAVIHPEVPPDAEVEVEVVVEDELSRVVVSDSGTGFEKFSPRLSTEPPGGYGLILLDAGASRWGTTRTPERFSVWFEVDHVAASEIAHDDAGREATTRP